MLSDSQSRFLIDQLFTANNDTRWVTVNFTKALKLYQEHSSGQLQSMLLKFDDRLEENPLDADEIVPEMIPVMMALWVQC